VSVAENISETDFLSFSELIDEVLLADDTNNDGYLSYAEYTIGKRRGLSKKTMEKVEPKVQLLNGQSSS